MAGFEILQAGGYASPRMPQPASANGPWGEAIRYWLNERKWRQADLVAKTGRRANTISRASRGFHTTTRVLEAIARAFDVPVDHVLVSPDRKLANEDRRRLAREIAEDVLVRLETKAQDTTAALDASFVRAEQATRRAEADERTRLARKRKHRRKN